MISAKPLNSSSKAELMEAIAQEAMIGIFAFDPGTRKCTLANRAGREALELSFDDQNDPSQLCIEDLVPKAGRDINVIRFSLGMFEKEGLFRDVVIRKGNGYNVIANVSIKHVYFKDGTCVHLLMLQDMTTEKKLERELLLKQEEIHNAYTQVLEQNQQLKDLDRAKDRFIAVTTHELRTPLSALIATAEVLHLKIYETEEQKDQFIKAMYEQGMQLLELVNDILDFAKMQAGKLELFVEKFDLIPTIAKLATGFDQMALQSNVKIEVQGFAKTHEGESQPTLLAYADELRLREVVNNVINNAIKYNRDAGNVSIRFHLLTDKRLARIAISDTGVGIPADRIGDVFNEFETIDAVSRYHKGTGLGMPISKRLMTAMGGDLTLKSEAGMGTTFYIDVPLDQNLDASIYRRRPGRWDDQAA